MMRKFLVITLFLINTCFASAQENSSFQAGEWLKFKLSYSGWMKAGNATLEIRDDQYKGKPVFHVIGKGWTTGAIKWFFKVDDRYESYFDKTSGQPYKFIRDIYEGGYTKNRIVEFDYNQNQAYVDDLKEKKKTTAPIQADIQDIVSAYYYLRNNYETESIKLGEVVKLNMFFDSEIFGFKLKFLGRETIKTKFGNVKCLKFRPYVMSGRVFHEEESVTLWVSADKNKVPLKIKADLRVGSLRSDLEAFKGLKHPFEIQF
jgi:hypothetical protein